MENDTVILNYVICFDGTWNETNYIPEKNQDATNVLKAARLIAKQPSRIENDTAIHTTVCQYYDGPGTKPGNEFLGGAFAVDLEDGLIKAYRTLCAEYTSPQLTSKDNREIRLFLFGFSRGAYRCHVFSWFLYRVGMTNDPEKVKPLVKAFLDGDEDKLREFCDGNEPPPRIVMMGLWDVVRSWFDKYRKIQMGEKSPLVDNLFHAMAADEKRLFFPVMHYKPDEGIEQCWFSGVHSEVGGGFANDVGLNRIAFVWIMNHAQDCGLNIGERMHQEDVSFEKRDKGNDAGLLCPKLKRKAKDNEKFHVSIETRIAVTKGEKNEYWPQLNNYEEFSMICQKIDNDGNTMIA